MFEDIEQAIMVHSIKGFHLIQAQLIEKELPHLSQSSEVSATQLRLLLYFCCL